MGALTFGYLFLWFIVFIISVAILRWAFRINKIVSELEAIRKALTIDTPSETKTEPKTPAEALTSKKSWF